MTSSSDNKSCLSVGDALSVDKEFEITIFNKSSRPLYLNPIHSRTQSNSFILMQRYGGIN